MAQNGDNQPWFSGFFRNYPIRDINKCTERQNRYMKCLEEATNEEDEKKIFKLLLLIDLTELEKYIAQTRLQARRSFMLSVGVAICGSILLLAAIVLGILSQVLLKTQHLEIVYLSAIAGLITQFISGIFFYFYQMTLRQINLFHSRLESSPSHATLFLDGVAFDLL